MSLIEERAGVRRMRICHVITGMTDGGAEMMLFKLLSRTDRGRFEHSVVSLTGTGPLSTKIEAINISVTSMGMRRGVPSPSGFIRLISHLRRIRPDVVQTWMYHADLLGGLAGRMTGAGSVLWGIRNGTLAPGLSKRSTIWVSKVCALLSSRLPTLILCCSSVAAEVHARQGYQSSKMRVVPNGFDLDLFGPSSGTREKTRHALGIGGSKILIGMFARFDPQKDYETFFKACNILAGKRADVEFVVCGEDVTREHGGFSSALETLGANVTMHVLGRRDDIPDLTNALDIATLSSSYGEAFPNVIGEAMACAVPCVATDVGESRIIVGATGRIVPPRDPASLADAWTELVDMGRDARAALGASARHRIRAQFELGAIVRQYEQTYEAVAGSRAPGRKH